MNSILVQTATIWLLGMACSYKRRLLLFPSRTFSSWALLLIAYTAFLRSEVYKLPNMKSIYSALAIGFLSQLCLAHIEMSSPYPINSDLDPDVSYNLKDYNYKTPLSTTGSNFPCKGYHVAGTDSPKASYTAGQSYAIKLDGSATHGGGSCQISLSYDNGKSFKVLKSIQGGCPLKLGYNFTVPSFAPSSNSALLAWR